MTTNTLDLTDLADDGDILDLDDGLRLRLRIETDHGASINDYDSDGSIQWVRGDTNWSPIRYPRPDGFDGRARIIQRDHPSALWWQPYPGLTEEQVQAEEPRILELATYGFKVVIVEVLDGWDAYNEPIVVGFATLGGVDSTEGGYLAEIVADLVPEALSGLR